MTMWALGWTHFSPALMVKPSPTQHKKKKKRGLLGHQSPQLDLTKSDLDGYAESNPLNK
jgi:hypothetical protein